jgi:hypothetical protein
VPADVPLLHLHRRLCTLAGLSSSGRWPIFHSFSTGGHKRSGSEPARRIIRGAT